MLAPPTGDFDLLASAEPVGEFAAGGEEKDKLLVWHKLVSEGFQPSARTGHSCVAVGYGVVAFGGVEAGQRVNSVTHVDVVNNSWSVLRCKGEAPSPRCFHAACAVDDYMVIHGGEGPVNHTHPPGSFTTPLEMHPRNDLGSSVASRADAPHYRPSNPMEGICPGDNMQPSRFSTGPVRSRAPSADIAEDIETIRCLDDMFVLDCASLAWVRIACTLSPLPRKGHTMSVCTVNGQRSLLVMGGYSLESAVVSNSLLVCEVEALTKYASQALSRRRTPKAVPADVLRPVVWRSVQTKGTLPCGRYRHSVSVVSTPREDLLVVVGGVGKDPSVALGDVHILNLGSLSWVQLNTLVGPHGALPVGDGPALGVFGHSAFPVRKPAAALPDGEDSAGDSWRGAEDYEIMVFGGSSNPSDIGPHGYHALFAFDLATHDWRRVQTGPEFPASRCFHAAAFIPHWSPFHELPFVRSSVRRNNSAGPDINQMKRANSSMALVSAGAGTGTGTGDECDSDESDAYLDLSAFHANEREQCALPGSILVFGGMSINKAVPDCWVLDLQWRSAGLSQFDDTMALRLQEQMRETYASAAPELQLEGSEPSALNRVPFSASNLLDQASLVSKIVHTNNTKYLGLSLSAPPSKMRFSASEPFLPAASVEPSRTNKMKLIQHLTSASHQGDAQEADRDGVVLKIRKERALADMQLKEQKQLLVDAEKRVSDLSSEIARLHAVHEAETVAKAQEVAELRDLLAQSVEREKKLQTLNAEAYQLLGLHGVQRL